MVEDVGTAAEEHRLALRDLLSELNARIREVATRLDATAASESEWEFKCECGSRDCRDSVKLTLEQFDAVRAAGERIFAEGHVLGSSQAVLP